mmetsp:Transcript_33050/g.65528  ORF Transcript_33050/g.65528 Transcript_33050/m.65528 type:complete len:81 (+) Transcript_33050:1882-2124(+)
MKYRKATTKLLPAGWPRMDELSMSGWGERTKGVCRPQKLNEKGRKEERSEEASVSIGKTPNVTDCLTVCVFACLRAWVSK